LAIDYAQTNIQLYKQLISEGYSLPDIKRVRDTYQLAATLSSGQFRGCGKTFIAHLVGVASVLAFLRKPVEQIQAGLLHSVYTFGDFGGLPHGFTEKKRDRLRAVVGPEVEKLVHAFHQFKWDEEDIGKVQRQDPRESGGLECSVIVMRLAHEIEEHSDWSFLFDNKFDKIEVLRRMSMITEIAERMQEIQLAEYARQLVADVQQADPTMHSGNCRSGRVYTLVPESCRLRYTGRRIFRTFRSGASGWLGVVRKRCFGRQH
jgi:(p)ppGpp synthase/HD superfamily hydrolase